jgi:hypothetical protein
MGIDAAWRRIIWTWEVRRIVTVSMKAWIAWGVIIGERKGEGCSGFGLSLLVVVVRGDGAEFGETKRRSCGRNTETI